MGFLMDTHDSNVKKMLNTFQITHKKQSMQVDKVIQKFHGKREVNPTKFDLSLSQLY